MQPLRLPLFRQASETYVSTNLKCLASTESKCISLSSLKHHLPMVNLPSYHQRATHCSPVNRGLVLWTHWRDSSDLPPWFPIVNTVTALGRIIRKYLAIPIRPENVIFICDSTSSACIIVFFAEFRFFLKMLCNPENLFSFVCNPCLSCNPQCPNKM